MKHGGARKPTPPNTRPSKTTTTTNNPPPPKKGGNRKHWENHTRKTLNQLLVEMDGFESNEGVIVMAATNLPETLDAALKRPGRFDRMVAVPLPDVRGRKEILEHYIKDKPVAADVEPAALARQTGGMSGMRKSSLFVRLFRLGLLFGRVWGSV